MILFDPYPQIETGDELAILCHEIGHAIAWFSHCGVVGAICLEWAPEESGLEADILLLPRSGRKSDQNVPENYAPMAVRLLAGDVAYRMMLNKEGGQISIRGYLPNTRFSGLEDVAVRLGRDGRQDEDIVRAIEIALQASPADPAGWLTERLSEACAILNRYWSAVMAIAKRLEGRMPTQGQKMCIPGTSLITWLVEMGVEPGKRPPVEIVHADDVTDIRTSLGRLLRRLSGRHRVLRV
jgi:hypothetical protein